MQTGFQGNLWAAAAATGAGGLSAAVQLNNCRLATIFGHVSGATTLTVEFSIDGVNYYDSGITNAPAGNNDVGFSFDCAAPYVRVKSTNNVNATLNLAGS